MFVQTIEGRVTDRAAFAATFEEWAQKLKPGAAGFLGSTGGVAADGTAVIVARFDSAASAQRNSERPEQGAWWSNSAAPVFDGEPTFRDSEDAVEVSVGDVTTAGFVQLMKGKVKDVDLARRGISEGERWAAFRPDILGMLAVMYPGGEYTQAIYFSSEAAAREGEKKEFPADMQAEMEEMMSNDVGTPTFIDLPDPVFA